MRVYIMTAGELHKVGISCNPKSRRCGVHSPNGECVLLRQSWLVIGNGYDAERMAHRILDAHRLTGEWFACSYAETVRAVRQAVQHVNAGGYVPHARPKGLRPLRPRKQRQRINLVALQAEYIASIAKDYAHVR